MVLNNGIEITDRSHLDTFTHTVDGVMGNFRVLVAGQCEPFFTWPPYPTLSTIGRHLFRNCVTIKREVREVIAERSPPSRAESQRASAGP
jgi:hypothetical protein